MVVGYVVFIRVIILRVGRSVSKQYVSCKIHRDLVRDAKTFCAQYQLPYPKSSASLGLEFRRRHLGFKISTSQIEVVLFNTSAILES